MTIPENDNTSPGALHWDETVTVRIADADSDPATPPQSTERAARTLALLRSRKDALRSEITAALLDNYNLNWHGDDEDDDENEGGDGSETVPMDAETFESHLRLTAITFYADGGAELCYDDGGLFLGHTVVASANEAGQFLRATLAG